MAIANAVRCLCNGKLEPRGYANKLGECESFVKRRRGFTQPEFTACLLLLHTLSWTIYVEPDKIPVNWYVGGPLVKDVNTGGPAGDTG